MICSAQDLLSAQRQMPDGTWAPAKPLAAPGMTFIARIKAAWLCLTGRAAAVRWW